MRDRCSRFVRAVGGLRLAGHTAIVALLVGVGLMLIGCRAERPAEDTGGIESGSRDLSRLMLTWQRDPTTTMTIQWIESVPRLPLAEGQSDQQPGYRIPRVESGKVDAGRIPAWAETALFIPHLIANDADSAVGGPFDADAWVAWNDQGLLVYVDVTDARLMVNPDPAKLWDGDCIELFVSRGVGSSFRYQFIIAPGDAPDQTPPPYWTDSRPKDAAAAAPLAADFEVRRHEKGYRAVVLLPWSNLQIEPKEADTIGFQVIVNNRDEPEKPLERISWHPGQESFDRPTDMHEVELAATASPPVLARLETRGQHRLRLIAEPHLAGKSVDFYATDTWLVSGQLQTRGAVAVAEVMLPEPPAEGRWGTLSARLGQQYLASIAMPAAWGHAAPQPVELTYRKDTARAKAQRVRTEAKLLAGWPGQVLQRVELTGLEPHTRYRFKISGADRELGFRTMPRILDRPLRFAAGGDTRHRKDWMVRTSRVAMQHKPAFIVWGGDLAYANASEANTHLWHEWFEANSETLIDEEGFITPIIAGIGNHEVQRGYYTNHEQFEPTDEWRHRIAPYFYQFFPFPAQGYGALDFGDYLSLLILDTDHTNPIAGAQTAWLERALAERRGVPHVFPVYHVPAYPSNRKFDGTISARVRQHWTPLFDAHGIRVAFEHHDHTYKRTVPIRAGAEDPAGVVYIGDGAWGVRERDVHDVQQTWYLQRAESRRHAIIVTLEGNRQTFEIYGEDGELIDRYVDDR